MVVIASQQLSAHQAETLEFLGDDGCAESGFLQRDAVPDHYNVTVDPARLLVRGDYYFAFRRFAQIFLSQPASHTAAGAARLRQFLQAHQIAGIERRHTPEQLEDSARNHPLPPLKAITVNTEWFLTHWANPTSPADRVQALADWINAQDADVIVLQEMLADWFATLQPLVPQLFGEHFAYRGQYTNSELGIVSRHPIVEAVMYPQSWASSLSKYCYIGPALKTERGFGIATIDFHGTHVAVATLHSTVVDAPAHPAEDFTLSASTRQLHNADAVTAERIMTYLDLWTAIQPILDSHPVIVAGDFNVNPIHRELSIWQRLTGMRNALLDSHNRGVTDYTQANRGATCVHRDAFETYSACNRRVASAHAMNEGVLDYIFVNAYLRNLYTYIDKTTDAFSDHWAVAGHYRVQPTHDPIRLPHTRYPQCPPSIPESDIDHLIAYFQTVHLSLFCVQSDRVSILLQRENTLQRLRYLKSLYHTPNGQCTTSSSQ